MYYITLENGIDYETKIEVFSNVVPGYSTEGLISTNTLDYRLCVSGTTYDKKCIAFPMNIVGGETYYFRVSYISSSTEKLELLYKFLIQSSIPSNYVHYNHNSYTYLWLNYDYHTTKCGICNEICGSERHAVLKNGPVINGYKTCIACGGLANVGFITNPFSLRQTNPIIGISNNGSYLYENGLIALEDCDIEAYLNKTLTFIAVN